MSKYTTELRFYLETLANKDTSSDNYVEVINETWNKCFNFSFPIYDENHRETLCKNILYHYYFREIGHETVGRWKAALQSRMLEIMPYYNTLYEMAEEFNPMNATDVYIDREYTGKDDSKRVIAEQTSAKSDTSFSSSYSDESSGTNKNINTNSNTNKFLDTPQGGLDGIVSDDYLTSVTIDNGSGTNNTTTSDTGSGRESGTNNQTGSGTRDNTDTYNATDSHTEKEHRRGSDDYYKNFERYEQELFNIDRRIIAELSDLFFKLW